MTSKFQEILEPSQAPVYTHPHLNVSLEDILNEGRERSASESSGSSQSLSSTETPKSPTEDKTTDDKKSNLFKNRRFALGSRKGRG